MSVYAADRTAPGSIYKRIVIFPGDSVITTLSAIIRFTGAVITALSTRVASMPLHRRCFREYRGCSGVRSHFSDER